MHYSLLSDIYFWLVLPHIGAGDKVSLKENKQLTGNAWEDHQCKQEKSKGKESENESLLDQLVTKISELLLFYFSSLADLIEKEKRF